MLLSQRRTYRSIIKLPETTLPDLVVLTGPNGSGKSHLLQAIRLGHIAVDIAPDPDHQVGLYDWTNLVPNDVGITSVSAVYQHRDWFLDQIRNRRTERTQPLLDALRSHGLDVEFSFDPWRIFSLGDQELVARAGSSEVASTLRTKLNNIEADIKNVVRRGMGDDPFKRDLYEYFDRKGAQFVSLRQYDFDSRPFTHVGANMFQHSFGEMFFSYFEKQKSNDLKALALAKGRQPTSLPLSDADFRKEHGEPPWDFVNEMMNRARLDFEIDYPDDYEATQYIPKLTKKSTGTNVEFSALSSGEKILMSFAFCLYYSADGRQGIPRPKLLLLDEVDAPLHPSMSKVLLDIVKEVLVERENIPVILVTHSPSTVAVAPDDSVFLMHAAGTGLSLEPKRRAVSSLTADIPTMSIDFSGRRQVFVESDLDAKRYALLWQRLSPLVESERSLTFIGVGRRKDDRDRNSGCDQVRKTVKALSDGGNTSVLGLIDWDGKNGAKDRVDVLAVGARYAIENCLLDPLLIAATVLGEKDRETIGYEKMDTYAAFDQIDHGRLQQFCDRVSAKVQAALGMDEQLAEPQEVVYAGGLTLRHDARLLRYNAHKLEDAVKEGFPVLKKFHQTGMLLLHIIESTVDDYPSLCPIEVKEAFDRLCGADL